MEVFLRIGQLAEATGIDATLLRAWETRYGIPTSERTEGGQRIFPASEVERVKAMKRLVDGGFRPSEASQIVVSSLRGTEGGEATAPSLDDLSELLFSGRAEALAVLDRTAASQPIESVIDDLIAPLMREIGLRWSAGEISAAEEHAATWLIGSWITGQLRTMPPPFRAGLAITATPEGERHDLGLTMLGIHLRRQGLQVLHLGADVPSDDLVDRVKETGATVVVLGVYTSLASRGLDSALEKLSQDTPKVAVAVGGGWASEADLPSGVHSLPWELGGSARRIIELVEGTRP